MNSQRTSCDYKSDKLQSTTKMKQLYNEFQLLKTRISISQRKRETSSHKYNMSIKTQLIQSSRDHNIVLKHTNVQSIQCGSMGSSMKIILKEGIRKYLNQYLPVLQTKMLTKIARLEERLKCINQILPELIKVMKMGLSHKLKKQIKLINNSCNCHIKRFDGISLQKKYTEQIRRLTDSYQNKLTLLMSQIKDMATTSSTSKGKKDAIEVEQQLRKTEERLFLIQQQLTDSQINNSQLRKTHQQTLHLLRQKQKLSQHLQSQLQDCKAEIINMNKEITIYTQKSIRIVDLQKEVRSLKANITIQDLKKYQRQWIEKLTTTEDKLSELTKKEIFQQMKIQDLNERIKSSQRREKQTMAQNVKLLNQINNLQQQPKQINFLSQQNKNLRLKIQRMKSELGKVEKNQEQGDQNSNHKKFIEQQQRMCEIQSFMRSSNKNDNEMFESLPRQSLVHGHSHLILPREKKLFQTSFQYKKLQAEVLLIVEQNKWLKSKKDRIEDQAKANQQDQEKFQLQSQLLKDQIRTLNFNLKILDDCAICLLKESQISPQKIQSLQKDLKFTKEYKKKQTLSLLNKKSALK